MFTKEDYIAALDNVATNPTQENVARLEQVLTARLESHIDLGKEGNRIRSEATSAQVLPFLGHHILVADSTVAICYRGDDNAHLEGCVASAKRTLSAIHEELR